MDKVLKDPITPRKRAQDGQKEWNYKAPVYDNRTSCSVNAGDSYGTGFRCPTGTDRVSGYESGPIPMKSHVFSPDEIFKNGEDQKG